MRTVSRWPWPTHAAPTRRATLLRWWHQALPAHPLAQGVAFLLLLALGHALLLGLALVRGGDLTDPRLQWLALLPVLSLLVSVGLLVQARWFLPRGSPARAGLLLLIFSSGAAAPQSLLLPSPWPISLLTVPPLLTSILTLSAYALLLLGIVLLLPLHPGTELRVALRLFLESATVGLLLLVVVLSLGPVRSGSLPDIVRSLPLFWALDGGLVFAVGGLALHYGRAGGPLLGTLFASVCCLLVASSWGILLAWHPATATWSVWATPRYTLHHALLVVGVISSLSHPPQPPRTSIPSRLAWRWRLTVPCLLILGVTGVGIAGLLVPAPLLLAGCVGLSLLWVGVTVTEERTTAEYLISTRWAMITRERARRLHLAATREAAERSRQATDGFLRRVLHDLATPISTLPAIAHALRTAAPPHTVALLSQQSALLSALLEQASTYLHIRTTTFRPEPVDVAAICEDALAALRPTASAQGLTVTLIDDTPTSLIVTDPLALRRILDNLLSNAIEQTAQGGVTLTLTPAPAALQLHVTDTGPGIPAHLHQRLFAPGERGDYPQPLQAGLGLGMGLGLAIVHELTTALGGQVLLASQPGHGTTFTVVLPLRPPSGLEETDDHASYARRR